MSAQYHLKPKEGLVKLGHIQSAQGLKGHIRIRSETSNPKDICDYSPLWDALGTRQLTLHFIRIHKGSIICQIDDVNDRNAADALKGMALCVERERLADPEDEEFYYVDLIGLEVRDMDEKRLGIVRAVQNFGAGDLLDVQLDENRQTVFVPFTKEIVPVVKLKSRWLQVDPPKGLMDTTAASKKNEIKSQ